MRTQRASREPFDAPRQHPVVLLHPEVDAVVDRLGLAVGVAGADDEVVGVADHAVQVEHEHVDRELVGGVAGDPVGDLGAVRLGRGGIARERLGLIAPPPGRGRARRCTSATASGTSQRSGRPSATRARIIEEEMSMRGIEKKRTRAAAPGSACEPLEDVGLATRPRDRPRPARRARAWLQARASRAGRGPGRRPTMKVRSSPGSRSCRLLRVSIVKEGPGRSASRLETSMPLAARGREPAQLEPVLDARLVLELLVRRRVDGEQQHAVEPELPPAPPARTPCARRAAG